MPLLSFINKTYKQHQTTYGWFFIAIQGVTNPSLRVLAEPVQEYLWWYWAVHKKEWLYQFLGMHRQASNSWSVRCQFERIQRSALGGYKLWLHRLERFGYNPCIVHLHRRWLDHKSLMAITVKIQKKTSTFFYLARVSMMPVCVTSFTLIKPSFLGSVASKVIETVFQEPAIIFLSTVICLLPSSSTTSPFSFTEPH